MANGEMLRVLFEERFTSIQSYMKEQEMPLNIQERVENFFQYIWRRNRFVLYTVDYSYFKTVDLVPGCSAWANYREWHGRAFGLLF